MKRYIQITEGENNSFTLHPNSKGECTLVAACCDCFLVHDFDFKVTNKCLNIKITRQNRKTGQLRRWNGKRSRKK